MKPRFFLDGFADRRFLMSNVAAFAVLAMILLFPQKNLAETVLLSLMVLVVFPIGFIRAVLCEEISRYGISWGGRGFLFNMALVFFATTVFSLLVWGIASVAPSFLPEVPSVIRNNFGAFLSFVAISAVLNGASCFFFQGFLLSVWVRRFGWIGVPAVLFFFISFLVLKNGGALGSMLVVPFFWWFSVTMVSFLSASVPVSFGFLLFSDILLTTFLIFRT